MEQKKEKEPSSHGNKKAYGEQHPTFLRGHQMNAINGKKKNRDEVERENESRERIPVYHFHIYLRFSNSISILDDGRKIMQVIYRSFT
jgi:hypothetical protein